jgi:drug/metabolite transporter superfamily protein YnfA
MRQVAALMMLLVALVHLPPLVGVLGGARLEALYGVPVDDPDLAILLRHRAVLFGLLGAYQLWAVLRPAHRTVAFVAGIASLAAFLALVHSTPGHNAALARVATIDAVALVFGGVGLAAHLAQGRAAKAMA